MLTHHFGRVRLHHLLHRRRDRGDAELDALLVVRFALHVLGQVALGLEAEVAVLALVGPEVGVCPDVLLQHGGLLAPDPAAVADVLAPSPAADVRVVVVGRLVAAFNLPTTALIWDKGILEKKINYSATAV